MQVKGNVFKNKRVLMEAIHHMKAEKAREKAISEQFEARRSKNKATRERKAVRREERIQQVCALQMPWDTCNCVRSLPFAFLLSVSCSLTPIRLSSQRFVCALLWCVPGRTCAVCMQLCCGTVGSGPSTCVYFMNIS